MFDKLGGRKAAAFLTGLLVSVGVYILKGDISENLAGMIQFLVATYTAGNVGADIATSVQAKLNPPSEDPQVTLYANAAVDEAKASIEGVKAEVASVKQSVEATMASQEQLVKALGYCQNGIAYLVERMPPPAVSPAYTPAQQSQAQSRQPGNPFGI